MEVAVSYGGGQTPQKPQKGQTQVFVKLESCSLHIHIPKWFDT